MGEAARTLAVPLVIAAALSVLAASVAARADVVELRSGEWLRGTVVEQGEVGVVLDHALLGRLEIPGVEVAEVRLGEVVPREPSEPPPVAPSATAAVAEVVAPVRPGLLGTSLLRGWSRSIELGVNGSRGNSETFDARAGFAAGFEDDERRWRFEMGYARAEDTRETTDEEGFAELLRDWLLPGSPWFGFSQARYDYDRFKDWDHRAATSGGVGYQFLDDERWNLRGRAGLGVTRTFGAEDDEVTPEAVLGLEVLRRLGKGHEVAGYTTFYPDLSELGDYRNLTGAHWQVRFTDPDDLSLKVGFENVHETDVDRGTERNDLNYFGTLVYDF